MSALEELSEWLNRSDRSFDESFKFGINVCKTIEFAHQGKYEVVLNWFSKEFTTTNVSSPNKALLLDFVSLEFPQQSVSDITKDGVVNSIKKYITNEADKFSPEESIEMLLKLSSNPSYQVWYRRQPKAYFQLLHAVFTEYIRYFKSKEFVPSNELKFYRKGLDSVKNFILRQTKLGNDFGKYLLESLMVSSLFMYSEKVVYPDLLTILQTIYFDNNAIELYLKFSIKIPLAAALYCLDFAINFFRVRCDMVIRTLQFIKTDKLKCADQISHFAHALDLLRKYDVDIENKINSETEGLKMISEYVENCISQYSKTHFKLVLMLICSTVRLNPLSLDKIMFRITAEYMLAPKSKDEWDQYVEFLILMIDVFKKMGRSEKLIAYLIKSLKVHLEINDLSCSLKRKSSDNETEVEKKCLKTKEQENVTGASKLNSFDANELFLNVIREEFKFKHSYSSMKCVKWKHIAMAWPAESVGKHFSSYVGSLTSKPSLVIWKTLIFTLDENIKVFRTVAPAAPNEKSIVLLEFSAALLSQYLTGSRLPEHADKFGKEINETRDTMQKILQEFGEMLLECEHNNRTMEAYLEVCLAVGNFDLLLAYYCSEALQTSFNIHNYLSKDQWISLEQRIVNFGTSSVKYTIKQLNLQKLKAKWLSSKETKSIVKDVNHHFLGNTHNSSKILKSLFEDPSNLFLLHHVQESEKREILQAVLPENTQLNLTPIKHLLEDRTFLELVTLRIYELMGSCFDSKKAIMTHISTDIKLEDIKALLNQTKQQKSLSKHCDIEKLQQIINVALNDLPMGFGSVEQKSKLWAINLALFRDIIATQCDELKRLCYDLMSKLLHFGPMIEVFSILNLETCSQIFPPTNFGEFYQTIFSDAKIWNNSTETSLSNFLQTIQKQKLEITNEQLTLATLILQFFVQCSSKRCKAVMGKLIDTLMEYIHHTFDGFNENDVKKEKSFIESTSIVMQLYLNHEFVKNQVEKFDEWIQKIYRKYIYHSQEDESYVKLIGAAIIYRKQLGFDESEMSLILEEMWKKLLIDMKSGKQDVDGTEKILRLVVNHQTTQQLIDMIMKFDETLAPNQTMKMILCLSKGITNPHMGAVLSSCCHILLSNKLHAFQISRIWIIENGDLVLGILESLKGLCSSRKLPISNKFIDDMLSFLVDLRIKHFTVEDDDQAHKLFHGIYKGMVSLCSELIHCHSAQILNRVSQLSFIFKELLYALVSFRSNRLKFSDLETDEIEQLADLGHDLENLAHSMAKHTQEVKRVAPYLLSYAINASISFNNSIVRYPKIKIHVENICYELHSMCDHRVGGFILRASNDAARQFYENICKDYDKYRKFKGKV